MWSSCISDAQSQFHYGCFSPVYSIDLLYERRCQYDHLNMGTLLQELFWGDTHNFSNTVSILNKSPSDSL